MDDFFRYVFSFVCGQNPFHCWTIGEPFPLCQRCTGIYVGVAIATALHRWRPGPSFSSLFIHGILLLQIAPAGLYLFPQGPWLRFATGQLCGYGIVYYLSLSKASSKRQLDNWQTTKYVFLASIALGVVPVLVWGEVRSALALLALCGIANLVLLAIQKITFLFSMTFR